MTFCAGHSTVPLQAATSGGLHTCLPRTPQDPISLHTRGFAQEHSAGPAPFHTLTTSKGRQLLLSRADDFSISKPRANPAAA